MTPRLPSTAALVILAVLAGCKATAPTRDDARVPVPAAMPAAEPPPDRARPSASTPPTEPDPTEAAPAAVAPAEQESPPAVSAPPCTCAQPAPKPRPKRKKPTAPARTAEAQSVGPVPPPANAVVDAEVGRVDAPLTSILGKDVFSPKGENLGRIVDLLSDPEGRVRVAIIDFGGFLGVGTRRIAVDWPLLHFTPADKDKPLMLTVTREKLQSAPEYKDASSPRVLMPPATDPDASGAHAKK